MNEDLTGVKVDVGILKTQTATLTALCEKMDRVIEKIVDQQEKYISQVYEDMEKRRKEKEPYGRINAKPVRLRVGTRPVGTRPVCAPAPRLRTTYGSSKAISGAGCKIGRAHV